MDTIFKGNTEKCFQHYAAALPKGHHDLGKSVMPVALFTGVQPTTVMEWIKGRMPIGVPLVKLRHFLEARRYGVEELLGLDPPIRTVSRYFAVGAVEMEELQRALGYTNSQSVLRIFHGGTTPIGDKLREIKALATDLRPKFEQCVISLVERKFFPEDLPISMRPTRSTSGHHPTPEPDPSNYVLENGNPSTVMALAYLIRSGAQLAQALTTHPMSPKDQQYFCEVVRTEDVAVLVDLLKRVTERKR